MLWDRGGAPLHFVLAHFGLTLDPSPQALRWVSVALALGAVPLTFDLGRRLAGPVAGITAGAVLAASTMLGVYGTFGRMYALFAFVTALAADLFVRALERRTTKAALVAAFAAVLLPAAHPYGLLVLASEAIVALAVWRGRPLRPGLLVAAVGLLVVPFVIASLRLANRYGADVGADRSVVSPKEAARYLEHTLQSFAGGRGWLFLVFLALGVVGLVLLTRTQPAFAAFVCLALAAPLGLLLVVGTEEGAGGIYTRHMIFALPVWSAAIGVAVAETTSRFGRTAQAVAVATVAALAILAPAGGASDPRTAASGKLDRLAAPADWVAEEAGEDDVLFPYSPVYLAALPTAEDAVVLTRAQADLILRGLDDAHYPVGATFVALPLDNVELSETGVETPPGVSAQAFPSWLLLRAQGPFADRRAVLQALADALTAAAGASNDRFRMAGQGLSSVCNALESLGGSCPEP